MKTKPITYKKIDPSDARTARNRFDSTDRPTFVKKIANEHEADLKRAGLTDADIARMKDGKLPEGNVYQVHHKIPIDAGGTNDFSNLILMKHEPYHKTITNHQTALIKGMKPGDVKCFDYPIPEGVVYPP